MASAVDRLAVAVAAVSSAVAPQLTEAWVQLNLDTAGHQSGNRRCQGGQGKSSQMTSDAFTEKIYIQVSQTWDKTKEEKQETAGGDWRKEERPRSPSTSN